MDENERIALRLFNQGAIEMRDENYLKSAQLITKAIVYSNDYLRRSSCYSQIGCLKLALDDAQMAKELKLSFAIKQVLELKKKIQQSNSFDKNYDTLKMIQSLTDSIEKTTNDESKKELLKKRIVLYKRIGSLEALNLALDDADRLSTLGMDSLFEQSIDDIKASISNIKNGVLNNNGIQNKGDQIKSQALSTSAISTSVISTSAISTSALSISSTSILSTPTSSPTQEPVNEQQVINDSVNGDVDNYDDFIYVSDDEVYQSDDDEVHQSDDDEVHQSDDDEVHQSDLDEVHQSDLDEVHQSDLDEVYQSDLDEDDNNYGANVNLNIKGLDDNIKGLDDNIKGLGDNIKGLGDNLNEFDDDIYYSDDEERNFG